MIKALVFVALFAACALAIPFDAQAVTFPGYSGPPVSAISGYINVDQQAGRALFYVLVEAKVNPSTAPLVFWYQGGPGCSGLSALLTEHGPFSPSENGGLVENPVAWTNIANVVYLEQPAFVGYSYSNTTSDKNTGDVKSAIDNYAFVQGFLERWPQYKGRPTWFTGESYGGEYIPTLTEHVLADSSTQIYKQLEGFMIGNGVFFCGSMQSLSITLDLLYWHGLVSWTNYNDFQTNGCRSDPSKSICNSIVNKAVNEVGVIDQELFAEVPQQPSLDPDDLYQDFCTGNGTLEYPATVPVGCKSSGALATAYLNRADVQQALGVKGPNGGAPNRWTICTNAINYDITGNNLVPLYKKFPVQKQGFKMLLYSGDIDILTVPFAFTKPCLGELQRPNIKKWSPWFVNGQTAGYVEVFDTYTFATVKGAGHEAPGYQPLSAFEMFKRFLSAGNLDGSGNSAFPARANNTPLKQGRVLRELLRAQGMRKF